MGCLKSVCVCSYISEQILCGEREVVKTFLSNTVLIHWVFTPSSGLGSRCLFSQPATNVCQESSSLDAHSFVVLKFNHISLHFLKTLQCHSVQHQVLPHSISVTVPFSSCLCRFASFPLSSSPLCRPGMNGPVAFSSSAPEEELQNDEDGMKSSLQKSRFKKTVNALRSHKEDYLILIHLIRVMFK